MGQLYQALNLNKYNFNGFDNTKFKGESHVIGLSEDEELPKIPISLEEIDDDDLDQVQDKRDWNISEDQDMERIKSNDCLGNTSIPDIYIFHVGIFSWNGMVMHCDF